MVPSLKKAEPLTTGYRRIAFECLDTALGAIDAPDGRDAAIHTIRKQCKQLRALIRLMHSGSAAERRQECHFFRDLGRSLSALRDARVALDVHARLIEQFGCLLDPCVDARIRQLLIADLQARAAAFGAQLPPSDLLRQQLLAARQRARHFQTDGDGEARLQQAFVRAYRRARRAAAAATDYGHPEDFHEARKRAKDYWYQLEFLSQRWPEVTTKRTAITRRLTELLGDAQDFNVYREAVERVATADTAAAAELMSALAVRRAAALQAEAVSLIPAVYGDKPVQFAADIEVPARLVVSVDAPGSLHRAAG